MLDSKTIDRQDGCFTDPTVAKDAGFKNQLMPVRDKRGALLTLLPTMLDSRTKER